MSPDIKVFDNKGNLLASAHIGREAARAAALVLAQEIGNPTISFSKERTDLEKIHSVFKYAAEFSPKRKKRKN